MTDTKLNTYLLYKIVIGEHSLIELERLAENGKSEYVAGKLLGMLRANGKMMIDKDPNVPIPSQGE